MIRPFGIATLPRSAATAAWPSAVIDGDPQEASAHASLITQAQSLADRWPELKPHQAKAYLNALLRRVIVESARIVIEIDGERALAARGESPTSRVAGAVGADARRTDAGHAQASARRGNAADGPAPPVTRRAPGVCARWLCFSSS